MGAIKELLMHELERTHAPTLMLERIEELRELVAAVAMNTAGLDKRLDKSIEQLKPQLGWIMQRLDAIESHLKVVPKPYVFPCVPTVPEPELGRDKPTGNYGPSYRLEE